MDKALCSIPTTVDWGDGSVHKVPVTQAKDTSSDPQHPYLSHKQKTPAQIPRTHIERQTQWSVFVISHSCGGEKEGAESRKPPGAQSLKQAVYSGHNEETLPQTKEDKIHG